MHRVHLPVTAYVIALWVPVYAFSVAQAVVYKVRQEDASRFDWYEDGGY